MVCVFVFGCVCAGLHDVDRLLYYNMFFRRLLKVAKQAKVAAIHE